MRKAPLFPVLLVLVAAVVLVIYYVYSQPLADPNDTGTKPDEGKLVTPLELPTVDFANPAIGPSDAKVMIVEFGDYLCPACATLDKDLKQLVKDYPNDLRLVWKDLPNETSHPGSTQAAIAGRCAGNQGAFWEYHDLLMAGQAGTDAAGYSQAAATIGLDTEAFDNCLVNQTTKPLVDRDYEEGVRLQIDATPYIFINEQRYSGAVRKEIIDSVIQSELSWQAVREETDKDSNGSVNDSSEPLNE